ncbi:unnamed protein product [Candida verbasci]|uniref:Uncharacterized protein n=1 Tax=Candida verbasci TaxID=1227364 RepID=A0A9W4XAH0_9ASCO|nr:unnamed protein product [Candida verbasci]
MPKRSNNSTQSSPSNKKTHILNQYESNLIETWVQCGECATTIGSIVTAIKSFENAVNRDPSNITALIGLSSSLRLNDINLNETIGSQSSIERLNKSLIEFPQQLSKSHLIFKELSECYLLIGLNGQAHQSIQMAIQLQPQDPSLWLLSAQTLIRIGAKNHAANSLTHCLSLLPESKKNFNTQDIETARAAHAELAAIAAADGNINISIKELSATLSLKAPPLARVEEHIALWCALSTAKERANDIEGAIQACEDAELAVGKSDRIIMTHAYLLLLMDPLKNSNYAIKLLEKIIDLFDENINNNNNQDFLPWYLLGRAYSFIDQPRLAYNSYQVALRCAPNSPITWLAVGKLYLELKQLPDALAAYSQALRLQMDDGSPGVATAWDGLSCVYERCEDHLLDASDACQRASSCFKVIGDIKNSNFFENRSNVLIKASKNESLKPPLKNPPDVPSFLLRDLVALAPSERINYTQSQQKQQQQVQQLQQQQIPPQQIQQQHSQPIPSEQQTPLQQNTSRNSPQISMINNSHHQTPQQPPQQAQFQPQPPPQIQALQPPQQYNYPPFAKSNPPPPPPQLPTPQFQQQAQSQPQWSPQQSQQQPPLPPPPPPHQQPQQFYYHPVPIPAPPPLQQHQNSPPQPSNGSSLNSSSNSMAVPTGPPQYSYGQYIPTPGGVQNNYSSPTWRR